MKSKLTKEQVINHVMQRGIRKNVVKGGIEGYKLDAIIDCSTNKVSYVVYNKVSSFEAKFDTLHDAVEHLYMMIEE